MTVESLHLYYLVYMFLHYMQYIMKYLDAPSLIYFVCFRMDSVPDTMKFGPGWLHSQLSIINSPNDICGYLPD